VIGVALAFINPQAVVSSLKGVAGNTLLVVIRTLKVLDDMADPFLAFKLVMKGSKPLIKAIKKASNQVYYIVSDNLYILKVWVNNGWELQYRSAKVLKIVSNNGDGTLNVSMDGGTSFKIMGMEESLANFLEISQELIEQLKAKGLRIAQLEKLHKLPDFDNILKKLNTVKDANPDNFSIFVDNIAEGGELAELFLKQGMEPQKVFDGWDILHTAERNTLKQDGEIVEKVINIIETNKFAKGDPWDKQNFISLFKKHGKYGRSGVKVVDDYGVENIAGKTLSAEELLDVLNLAINNPRKGMELVLNDLCCNTNFKYIGAEYVLRYAKDNWDIVVAFEERVSNGSRIIDIVSSESPFRRELKSWASFADKYKSGFLKEFAEDLTSVDDIEEMGWFFDKKGDFADPDYLKMKVLETLASEKGKEALQIITKQKASDLFNKNLMDLTDDELVSNIIQNIDTNFNNIFQW